MQNNVDTVFSLHIHIMVNSVPEQQPSKINSRPALYQPPNPLKGPPIYRNRCIPLLWYIHLLGTPLVLYRALTAPPDEAGLQDEEDDGPHAAGASASGLNR